MSENSYLSNIGKIPVNIEPYILTDVSDPNEVYVGTSQKGNQPTIECWKIKKIWKDGDVWKMGFPNAKQSFTFIWDARKDYDYN